MVSEQQKPVGCWTPEMCEHKDVSTTNKTTVVSFDKINTPNLTKNCKCVEGKQ